LYARIAPSKAHLRNTLLLCPADEKVIALDLDGGESHTRYSFALKDQKVLEDGVLRVHSMDLMHMEKSGKSSTLLDVGTSLVATLILYYSCGFESTTSFASV
jgi:hypothetical protein